MLLQKNNINRAVDADVLADFAVEALLEEVRLTPKPGLVDCHGNGSHHDLTLYLMELSATTLRSTFHEMAMAVKGRKPSQEVREALAAIGREGEQRMLAATNGVNTHKGAIWSIGLLTGAAGMLLSTVSDSELTAENILTTASAIAQFQDRYMPVVRTNGDRVRNRYAVRSAREEAVMGFPSLQHFALPALERYRDEPETIRRINVLLSLMAVTDDTCILNRSDMQVLRNVQQKAAKILDNGGFGHENNWQDYMILDDYITDNWVSPGGSADLLAAALFVQKITDHYKN